MFVYSKNQSQQSHQDVSSVMVLAALVLGALSKVTSFPGIAGLLVVMVALFLIDLKEEFGPLWIGRLSLASTSVFYLGLGHCLGLLSLLALPMVVVLRRA